MGGKQEREPEAGPPRRRTWPLSFRILYASGVILPAAALAYGGVFHGSEDIDMLGDIDAIANVAVRDLDIARKFYEGKLGLTPADSQCEGVIVYRSGNSKLYVYRSDFAGTNQATAVSWEVGEQLDELVRSLTSHGVAFEHYEMPDMTLEGDVHVAGDLRVAWFKDPDGNILSLTKA